MKNRNLLRFLLVISLVITSLACQVVNRVLTPGPTNTPRPTFTATPTHTPITTPTPIATPTPPTTATPAPGLGVPMVMGKWQIAIMSTRQETSIASNLGISQTTYTPKEGYIFLIVEFTGRPVDPAQTAGVNSRDFAVIDQNGHIYTADGGGFGSSVVCMSCTFFTTSTGSSISLSLAFVVDKNLVDQPFKFQYKDMPAIDLPTGKDVKYAFQTEIGAFPSGLPASCQAGEIKPIEPGGLLSFMRWSEAGSTLGTLKPDGSEGTLKCTNIAYGDLQLAPDGAALLHTGALQGWASLSIIEPDGKVTTLVKNSPNINARFDATGQYVLFTTPRLGEQGVALYVFDRKAGKTDQLNSGNWINFRTLADKRLLISVGKTGGGEEVYIGEGNGSGQKAIQLPEGVSVSDVADDGQHVIYASGTGADRTLYLGHLENPDKKEIYTGNQYDQTGALSPDGRFLLHNPKADDKYKAVLLNLETGVSADLISNSDGLSFSFSPNSQWALITNTENVEVAGSDKKETKTTLWVVEASTGRVVQKISDVMGTIFSPDSQRLAYTVRKSESEIEMFILTLPDGQAQSLGPGRINGWYGP